MAGTKLLLSFIYLIEIPLLIVFAIYYASTTQSSSIKKVKWNPFHQPFLPYRNTHFINSQQTLDTLNEIKSFARQPRQENLHLRFLGTNGSHLSHEFKQSSFMALLQGLEHYNSNNIKLHNVEHSLDLQADCTPPWDSIEQDYDGHGHTLFIATNCNQTLLTIQENGNMFVQFQKQDNIFKMFQNEIAKEISKLYPVFSEAPIGTHHILMSIVDPDPNSHTLPAISHLEHVQKVLNHELEYTLRPMLDAFHIYASQISIQVPILYPYYARDLSQLTKKNEYTDESVDYTIATKHVKEALLYTDMKHVVQNTQFHVHHDNVIHLVLFVPHGNQTPSYLTQDGSWSRALSIPDRNIALAIVNIPSSENIHGDIIHQGLNSTQMLSEQDIQELVEDVYQHEISRAVAYLGTFLRTHFGLSAVQPHRQEYDNESNLKIEHEQTYIGIATWELEALRRNQFLIMTREILESLENIQTLIQVRSRLSIGQNFAETYERCLDHLVHAISLNEDGDVVEATRIITVALQYIQELKTDGDTFELPYTAPDQYFAIFGSLLLPLLVPIIKNFMIEFKDYKRKTLAKKLSQKIR